MPKKATLKAARKERDAERSKQALLEAAQRLFSGRGYTEGSVRDIAADAGINPALVRYYFGSKQEIFTMALDELIHTRSEERRVGHTGVSTGRTGWSTYE